MNYELLKQLKDAGHPFVFEQGDGIHLPTLEELIEACGDKFFALKHHIGWIAVGWDGPHLSITGVGKTPEEAVANLYLALNQKTDE